VKKLGIYLRKEHATLFYAIFIVLRQDLQDCQDYEIASRFNTTPACAGVPHADRRLRRSKKRLQPLIPVFWKEISSGFGLHLNFSKEHASWTVASCL